MNKKFNLLKSFAFKVTVFFVLALSLSSALSNFLIRKLDAMKEQEKIRWDLNNFAVSYGFMLDAETLLTIPLNREAVFTKEYAQIFYKLRQIEELNPKISYLYVVVPSKKIGEWQYIIPPPFNRMMEEQIVELYPGDKYDMPDFSKNNLSLKNRLVESGYGPIRDKDGQVVAYLGVDVYKKIFSQGGGGGIHRLVIFAFLIILVALVFGLFTAREVIRPITKLIEGTRRISTGDFSYKVDVNGKDEISELGRSFNEMAINLAESRKALNEYFFKVVQSLVTGLEAKDSYTRGHSDRVSDYAVEIANKMGFPTEKIELLRRAAQLHDIGKIGLSENILNKNGKPTDEEWKLIREHPAKGEEILEPVFLDKEMLVAVRWHHERYDGKGYPDGRSGESMNIFAQIIAVADTYDAMTSARSYRPALPYEEAVKRLKEASGSQFNPEVVDIFLKIIEEKLKK